MRFGNENKDRTYPGNVFHVTSGRGSIHKAIQKEIQAVKDALKDKYAEEETIIPGSFKIKQIYINKVKQDLTDFKDIKMFGTILEFRGYGLGGEEYKYKNACVVEYHVEMFNKKYTKNGQLNDS